MSIEAVIRRLEEYGDKMDFYPPIGDSSAIRDIPAPYAELLGFFNGGEIFIPGTVIYSYDEAMEENTAEVKDSYDIPDGLFIIGRTNYDAPICMERESPYKVILWDDENGEPESAWDSITDFFEEEISDYLRYLREI